MKRTWQRIRSFVTFRVPRARCAAGCKDARRLLFAGMALLMACTQNASAQLLPTFGRDRAGTSGFQFLKIPVDARSAAMGETVASNAFDAASLFWNPALAAQVEGTQVGMGHVAYHADVTIDYLSAVTRHGRFHFGLSLQALNSGQMDVTTEFQPFGTGETFRFMDLAAGLTVAQELTDLFSYGVTARYVQESVAGLDSRSVVFDLGAFYRIGTTGARMAVAIRNFGMDGRPKGALERAAVDPGRIVESDFERFTPPTTFLLGVTYDVIRAGSGNFLQISGQLTNPNDNAENLNLGAEYGWRDTVMLRAGYRFGVEEIRTPSFGVGLLLPDFGPSVRFDYAFGRMDRLGAVHRAGLNIAL